MHRTLSIAAACLVAAIGTSSAQDKDKPAPKGKTSAARAKAEENYAKTCQACHGPEGRAPLPAMSLADSDWKHGSSLEAVTKTIAEGVPGTAMLPNKDKFTKAEIAELARLVRSWDPALNAKKPAPKPKK